MDGNVKTGKRETVQGFETISWWTDEGTTLNVQVNIAGGTFTSTTNWATAELAAENADAAFKASFQAILTKVQQGTLQVGTNNKVKRVETKRRNIFLTRLGGPPTWWWPHADLRTPRWRGKGEWVFMLGWFRRAFVLSIKKKEQHERG